VLGAALGVLTPALPIQAAAPPGTFDVRIERDPESGGWRLAPLAPASRLEAEEEMRLNQSSDGLVAEPIPGGGEVVDLKGRFQSFSVARRDADGSLRTACLENPLSLLAWWNEFLPPAAPSAAPEK
jgi:hypothetical protein